MVCRGVELPPLRLEEGARAGLLSLPKEASPFPPLALLHLMLPMKYLLLPSVAMGLGGT